MQTGKQILVVDDLETATDNVIRILKHANYTDIDCLHNAASALSALRKKKYDLVITDTQMKPISGSELTKLIRVDGLSKVKIILIGLGLTPTLQNPLSRETSRKKLQTCSLRSLGSHPGDARELCL